MWPDSDCHRANDGGFRHGDKTRPRPGERVDPAEHLGQVAQVRPRLRGQALWLKLASPSPAEASAPRTDARAAVSIACSCSSVRRHCACVAASIAVASAAARYPIADLSIPSASATLRGDAVGFVVICHLLQAQQLVRF